MILGEAVRLVAPALALGLAVALLSRRAIAALLFGVSATDVSTLASVAMVVALVSLIAACIPARRAASIDPTVAMRAEV
jgi:putative ABC transport system permease protein